MNKAPDIPLFRYDRPVASRLRLVLGESFGDLEIAASAVLMGLRYRAAFPRGEKGIRDRVARINKSARRLLNELATSEVQDGITLPIAFQLLACEERKYIPDPVEALTALVRATDIALDNWARTQKFDLDGEQYAEPPGLQRAQTNDSLLSEFIREALDIYKKVHGRAPEARRTSGNKPQGKFSLYMDDALRPIIRMLGLSINWPALRSRINRAREPASNSKTKK